MSATETVGGEWCGPTRQLKNSQLNQLVHKSRKIITEDLRVVVEVTREDEAVLLVNKPPEDAAVIGAKVDALPEAVVLEIEPLERRRETHGSGSMYPMHRDTLRPLRILLLLLVISAAVTGAAMFV
jgi:hypothetical protein